MEPPFPLFAANDGRLARVHLHFARVSTHCRSSIPACHDIYVYAAHAYRVQPGKLFWGVMDNHKQEVLSQ